MRQLVRRVLRLCGVKRPSRAVICPAHVKAIRFDADWRAEVIVRRTLVFLELPDPGDLHDFVPVDAEDPECVIDPSPDAKETTRVPYRGGTRVSWKPHEPIVRYGLYVHQHGWRLPASYAQAALYTEVRPEVRTGSLTLEIVTPVPIETAVAFACPWWRRKPTERTLVKEALSRRDFPTAGPTITDAGQRVTWTLTSPRIGERYICVMFTAQGMTQWQRRLKETSMRGRLERLVRSIVPA